MNKSLFWTGLILQLIHLIGFLGYFGILALAEVDFSFLTKEFMVFVAYILFNVLTLLMIVCGLISED